MTRLNLNWIGAPSAEAETNAIFRKLWTTVGWWVTINIAAASSFTFHLMSGIISPIEIFVFAMVNFWMYGFCVFVTGNTRSYLREIYNIQEPDTDYLLSAIYMPWTIAQMGRHTADYNSLRARLCTATGLSEGTDYSFVANINSFNSYGGGSYVSFNDDDSYGASTYASSVGRSSAGGSVGSFA